MDFFRFKFSANGRVGATAWEWTQVALLVANLAWTTACLGGYRAETMVITSALSGALLAVHFAGWAWGCADARTERPRITRFHPAGWMFVPFLVYAAANVRWVSPVPWIGWRDWLGWAQMIAVFWVVLNGVVSRTARATLFWSIVGIGFAAVLVACYQRFVRPDWLPMGRVQAQQFFGRASGSFGIPNSLAALLLLLLPPMIALAFRRGASAVQRVWGGYLAAVFAFGIFLSISRGAWLAAAAVAVAWPLFALRGSMVRRIGWMLAAASVVAAVSATLFFNVPRVRERLTTLKADAGERTRAIMWRGAWEIFQEHPLWGSGGGSYNTAFEKYRPAGFQDEPVWAHNDYLNTLSDYGAVGFSLFFGAGATIGLAAMRSDRRRRGEASVPLKVSSMVRAADREQAGSALLKGMAAGLVAFGLQMFVDFHFKIPALAMTFGAMAGLAVQRAWPSASGGNGGARGAILRRGLCAIGAVVVIVGTVDFARPRYLGEALRHGAREEIDRIAIRQIPVTEWPAVLRRVTSDLEAAVRVAPENGSAWADYAYAKALWAAAEPARKAEHGGEALRAADRALACSTEVPEFWVRRGVALDGLGRGVEAGGALVEALKLAPASASVWYYQAFHLSLDRGEWGRAVAAARVCLRLDPQNRDAQALLQRLTDRGRSR